MKKHLFLSFPLLLAVPMLILSSCCKSDETVHSACINEKIEAFKTETSALSIYEIAAPDGKLYLFQHACSDCGDYTFNSDCEEICVTNVEGYDPGMVPCEQAVYDSSRTLIWKK